MNFLIQPGGSLNGEIKVAGDKSVSHRSVIFGALADGVTHVADILEGEDVLATMRAFRQMGVDIQRQADGGYVIRGVGLHGLSASGEKLDMGNSGTAFRLLAGVLSGQGFASTLVGDDSLTERPMGRIIDPLLSMGAKITSRDKKPPVVISPSESLQGIHYDMPIASAQVKSCLLLAGMYAHGETSVSEPAPTRDHTERMLAGFGYAVRKNGNLVALTGGGQLQACDLVVPADLSSATFFIVGGLIAKNSELLLSGVGVNPSRNGILPILQRMGAKIEQTNQRQVGGEPVADLVVRSSELKGCDIRGDDIALAIDEIPAIAVAAATAEGSTSIRQAEELRVKESDRIHSVVQGLRNIGVQVEEHPDGMTIHGGGLGNGRGGGQVSSFHDHRIAMAFSMAGLAAAEPISILDCDNVATSFPDFADLARKSGLLIKSD